MLDKIKNLFDYRKIPFLLSFDKNGIAIKLQERLIQLQKDIYNLDKYLESTWDIEPNQLATYWQPIHESMTSLGVESKEHKTYLSLIKRYQEHELGLRNNAFTIFSSLGFYYYYKSCDVKLIRKLLFEHIPNLAEDMDLADWLYFDLITEINDDIADIQEDKDVLNGNAFVLKSNLNGIEATYNEYVAFLKNIQNKNNSKRYIASNAERSAIYEWTDEACNATLALLKSQKIEIENDSTLIDQNKIIEHLALLEKTN